jgi:hypothetical protein
MGKVKGKPPFANAPFRTAYNLKLGKRFLDSFKPIRITGKKGVYYEVNQFSNAHESPNSLLLKADRENVSSHADFFPRQLAYVGLGFKRNAVIIEAMSGEQRVRKILNQFTRDNSGEHAFNFLIRLVEEHAKKNGFSKVMIRLPETLYYYKTPYTTLSGPVKEVEKIEKIRNQMRKLYGTVAEAMGYERKRRFFVKKL